MQSGTNGSQKRVSGKSFNKNVSINRRRCPPAFGQSLQRDSVVPKRRSPLKRQTTHPTIIGQDAEEKMKLSLPPPPFFSPLPPGPATPKDSGHRSLSARPNASVCKTLRPCHAFWRASEPQLPAPPGRLETSAHYSSLKRRDTQRAQR